MKRKYVKKSDWWNRSEVAASESKPKQKSYSVKASFDDKEHYTAQAACGGGASRTYRDPSGASITDINKYQNIKSGIVPFNGRSDGIYNAGDALELVYRAYFNVAVIRNAINLMMDFSASPIHVKSENTTVKKFYESWLETINIEGFAAKYFLEYYRSGNVFIYSFDGKIEKDKFQTLKKVFAAKSDKIPVKYIILNPMQISFTTSGSDYIKALSTYEIERLKHQKTDEDKQMFLALPPEIQRQISKYQTGDELFIPLDPMRLYYTFYRKTDYEPMAVPMVYPVLNDVEAKLELKKMDMALARTIEQVILLVTTGEKADEYNAGLNVDNLQALQDIFKNQTIGRVLVADYTTKAEWKIPDLKDMLGKEKYERVDMDIKEGLQYVFFGDEKFSSATIKSKIFIESLKEGRRCFLKDFLIPEAKRVGKAMGFKNIPKFEMESIEIENTATRDKLFVQMAQLGLITPDELNISLETGLLPDKDESIKNQKEYMKQRLKDQIYTPLLGGSDLGAQGPNNGRPDGAKAPQTTKNISPVGTTKGRFSMAGIVDNTFKMNQLMETISSKLKTKWKIKEDLNVHQKNIVKTLTRSVALSEDMDNWTKASVINKHISSPKNIDESIGNEIDNISLEFDTDSWTSTILYLSPLKD